MPSLLSVAMRVLTAAVVVAAISFGASAGDFPSRSIEITVPFAPGGTPDILARALSDGLSHYLKQSVIVVNKLGAGGIVGAQAVAHAQADGYSLLFAPALVKSVAPLVHNNPNFHPERLQPLCQTFETQMALVVKPDSPYKTAGDIIEAARAHPGTISYGHAGVGSIPHLSMIELASITKTTFNAIPYKGDAEVPAAVLGGVVDFGPMTLSSVPRGAVRIIAIFAQSRNPGVPDIPTVKEQGFDVSPTSFGGLYVPAGVPQDVLKKLEDGCKFAAAQPLYVDTAKRALLGGTLYKDAEAFATALTKDIAEKKALLAGLGYPKK